MHEDITKEASFDKCISKDITTTKQFVSRIYKFLIFIELYNYIRRRYKKIMTYIHIMTIIEVARRK